MSPRQRRAKPAPAKRRPRRDYRAEYARRNARARAAGFASYYDYRVRAGSLEAPRPKGETLRRRRGHAAGKDLVKAAREGDLLVAQLNRDSKGRFRSIDVTLIHEDGSEQEFTLKGRQLDPAYLRGVEDEIAESGVAQSYGYPIRNVIAALEKG